MNHSMPYGAQYTPEYTVFRLWAPQSRQVLLQRFAAGSDEEPGTRFLGEQVMEREGEGVFSLTIQGNLKNQYYQYLLTDYSGKTVRSADPWALASGVNGQRSMVVNLAETDPPGWEQDVRPKFGGRAPVIWETHVRDFSDDPRCGVTPRNSGTYLGFTEENTTLDGAGKVPTCLNYLRRLGVTHVQLQPIFDFETADEACPEFSYNWGYDPENYNVPEGSYSTDPRHGAVRIRECKAMIQALHRAGIGVIMDVVYNHTYRVDSWLQRTAPGCYYRTLPDGSPANASGCGNETASERAPFREYMVESVCYWAEEYHIDGFRFDLMGIHDVRTMREIRSRLNALPGGKKILTFGEPWAAEPPRLSGKNRPADKTALSRLGRSIGVFCDETRNALTGSPFSLTEPGYGTGEPTPELAEAVRAAVRGWCDSSRPHYAAHPLQLVQYVSCHDNYALWDRLLLRSGGTDFNAPEPELLRRNRLLAGIYLTLPGYAFFQSGEEFGRTKQGDDNSHLGPPIRNQLDWKRTVSFRELLDWYRGLLGLRKWLRPLRGQTLASVIATPFLDAPDCCVGYCLPGGGRWSGFAVYYNPHEEEKAVSLPSGSWQILCDGEKSDLWKKKTPRLAGEWYVLPPESVVVLGKLL